MKKNKKIPKNYLPKFDPGGKTDPNMSMYSQADQNALQSSGTDQDMMNTKRMNNINQYASYAAIAANTAGQIDQINNSDMGQANKTQATSGAVGNGITQGLGTVSPYIAAGTGLRKSATSMVGDQKGANRTVSNWMAAPHEAASNDIGAMKYAENDKQKLGSGIAAIGDITGATKLRQMFSYGTGNDEKTTGFWGKYNDLSGISSRNNLKKAVNAENGITQVDGGAPVMYPNGGEVPREFANSEIESQENVVAPNGGFLQANGPSHSQGGVPVALPGNSMIFSDRLKLGKKTFADLNKPNNTNKEDKILESDKQGNISKRTAELMKFAKNKNSEALFNIQESLKQAKVQAYAKKMGVTLPQPNTQVPQQEFANGGVQPMDTTYMGYNTNFNFIPNNIYANNKNYSDSRRKVEYAMGGVQLPMYTNKQNELPQFFTGGRYVDGVWVEDNQPEQMIPIQTEFTKPGIPNAPVYNPSLYGIGKYDPSMQELQGNPQIQEVPQYNNPYNKPKSKTNWNEIGSNVAMGLANNAGNIYNLSRYDKPEIEKYDRLKAAYLDPSASLRDADMQSRRAEYAIREASGGSAGTYLANRGALSTQNVINKDRINKEYQNANAGISNSVGQYNNELSRAEVIANAQNRARNRSGKGEAIGSVGSNVAKQIMDNKKGNMDQKTLQMYMQYYNNPEFRKAMEKAGYKLD